LLLENGAQKSVNITDKDDKSLLQFFLSKVGRYHRSSSCENLKTTKYLVESGAKIEDTDFRKPARDFYSTQRLRTIPKELIRYLENAHALQQSESKLDFVVGKIYEGDDEKAKDTIRLAFCESLRDTLDQYVDKENYFETTLFSELCKKIKDHPKVGLAILKTFNIEDAAILEKENHAAFIDHLIEVKDDFCFDMPRLLAYKNFLEDYSARRKFVFTKEEMGMGVGNMVTIETDNRTIGVPKSVLFSHLAT